MARPSPLFLLAFLILGICVPGGLAAGPTAVEPQTDSTQLEFFEKKIRPVLAEHCYECHSEKAGKNKGNLVLDTREGLRTGGDSGPAVVPGDPEHSRLLEAVRYHNPDLLMPPKKKGGKLPAPVIGDLEKWVRDGAADPRVGGAPREPQAWWAFQPVQNPAVPENAGWGKTPIDAFILAGLEKQGLRPVGEAGKAALLRRATFDLTGLPPAPADQRRYLADPDPDAFEKVVDRLLASPQFGERWGRHWLDVARYAESSGRDVNLAFPAAWRYRDYVIDAFNADKPFDRFVREQVAGDLLPSATAAERASNVVATGFLALGPKALNEQSPRQFHLDLADEQIDTVTQTFLGLTVACARCHDHKLDPVSQREYYALAGIFLSTDTRYGTAAGIQNRHPSPLVELPHNSGALILENTLAPEERRRMEKQLADARSEVETALRERFTNRQQIPPDPRQQLRFLGLATQIGALESDLAAFEPSGKARPLAMGVLDLPASAADIPIPVSPLDRFRQRFLGRPPEFAILDDSAFYVRGESGQPGEKVPRGFPSLFRAGPVEIPSGTSGRLQLADALVSASNPLTKRVIVNRVWHWIFGTGLVASPDNFGTGGRTPSHPELLDHLAWEFQRDGGSLKRLIRRIVLSKTYQLDSTFDPGRFRVDPENHLHWRRSPRVLEAECVRDALLSVAGVLDLNPPLASAVAEEGEGPLGGLRGPRGAMGEERIVKVGGTHRSVYLPVPRDIVPDALAVFDFAENSLVTGSRETTNVPSQALYLLNSPFVHELAMKTGRRVLASGPDPTGRLQAAYRLILGRDPSPAETRNAEEFQRQFGSVQSGLESGWSAFCHALFATSEFRQLP
jgi:hypothetical protein